MSKLEAEEFRFSGCLLKIPYVAGKEPDLRSAVEIHGNEHESSTGLDIVVVLKLGCRVLITRNAADIKTGVYNGATGEFLGVGEDGVLRVKLDNPGTDGPVVSVSRSLVRVSDQVSPDGCMTYFHQFAVKLGYAVTVHKAQVPPI